MTNDAAVHACDDDSALSPFFLIYLPRISLALVIKALGCICLAEKGVAAGWFIPRRSWRCGFEAERKRSHWKRETLLSSRAKSWQNFEPKLFKTLLGNIQRSSRKNSHWCGGETVWFDGNFGLWSKFTNLLILIGRCGVPSANLSNCNFHKFCSRLKCIGFWLPLANKLSAYLSEYF